MEGYEKLKIVGRGAYGTVFLCRRLTDGQLVIIKQIPIDDMNREERQTALNEVRVLAMLNHPNIIAYYDSFLEDKALMIAMEYAEGGTIFEYLHSRDSLLDEEEIMRLFVQIALSLQHVHAHNILHRDLKTQNIMLDRTKTLVKICDFGISKVLSTKTRDASTVIGTPCYISPELCEGKCYNQKSDIWALGCILYELASRSRAFEAQSLPALVMKIVRGTFAPISPRYSNDLRQLILAMLHTDPAHRPRINQVLAHTICMKTLLQLQCTLGVLPPAQPILSSPACPRSTESRPPLPSEAGKEKTTASATPSIVPQNHAQVWMWGGGLFKPTALALPGDSQPIAVALGRTHQLALTADSRVLSWQAGVVNDELHRTMVGRSRQGLGRALPSSSSSPCFIEALTAVAISKVACGDMYMALVTDRGILMTCGVGIHGALGHGQCRDVNQPKIVEVLLSHSVEKLSCGADHMAVITATKELYTWGRGDHGCLGLDSQSSFNKPQRVQLSAGHEPHDVFCGSDCTLLVTRSGRLLACGSNRYNKLALGLLSRSSQMAALSGEQRRAFSEEVTKLTEVSRSLFENQHVALIATGTSHTAVLTDSGKCYTCGSNSFGQLGYRRDASDREPHQVPGLDSEQLSKVACGDTFTVVATKGGSVFAWGKGKRGRLGSAEEDDIFEARRVVLGKPARVISLACSHGSTMIVTEDCQPT